jgi:hypothetical protein
MNGKSHFRNSRAATAALAIAVVFGLTVVLDCWPPQRFSFPIRPDLPQPDLGTASMGIRAGTYSHGRTWLGNSSLDGQEAVLGRSRLN